MNRGPDVETLNIDKLGLKGDTFDLEGDKISRMSKARIAANSAWSCMHFGWEKTTNLIY